MKSAVVFLATLLACAVVGIDLADHSPLGAQSEWRPAIASIPSPAADASGQPQLTVSTRGVLLSWVERSGSRAALKFAERTAARWSDPRTIASGDDWFVNWADVPSVQRLDDGTLAAHWLQKSGRDTYAYDVRLSSSNDDGRTWSPSFLPHHDGTNQEHGFASLFQMPGAGLGLVWLDGRNMSAGGAMSVYFGTFDRSWKQTGEMPVDLRVCECCPTTAAVTSEGPIVAYRNRSAEEIRDIYVARFERGKWTDPAPVHTDGWKIAACPVNGPMLSARGRDVVLAWFTVQDEVGHAYLAFSRDAGRSFGQPIRLDETSAIGRVDVALLPDGSAAATWIEFAEQQSSFSLRRVRPSGDRSSVVSITAIDGGRASGYPRLAHSGDELVFAWTENRNGIQKVNTAVARLQPETR
jgi:hypothetical protein